MNLRDVALVCASIILAGLLIALLPRLLPPQAPGLTPVASSSKDAANPGSQGHAVVGAIPSQSGKDAVSPPRPPSAEAKATRLLRVVVSRRKGLPADWRLYLDGKLVGGQSEPFAFRIEHHTAWSFELYHDATRLLSTLDAKGGVRWSVLKERVEKRFEFPIAGAVRRVKIELLSRQVVFDPWGRALATFPYRYDVIQHDPHAAPHATIPLHEWNRRSLSVRDPVDVNLYAHATADGQAGQPQDRIRKALTATETDPLVRSLLAVHTLFQANGRATRRTVLLELPQEHGGPRECDGAQVRVLVDWLVEKHWGWVPPEGVQLAPVIFAINVPTAAKARAEQAVKDAVAGMNRQIQSAKTDIRRLAQVAKWLDEAAP